MGSAKQGVKPEYYSGREIKESSTHSKNLSLPENVQTEYAKAGNCSKLMCAVLEFRHMPDQRACIPAGIPVL